VLQQTPFEVISAFPSEVIIPPPVAEKAVILVTEEVDKFGNSSFLHECKIVTRNRKPKTVILMELFIGDNRNNNHKLEIIQIYILFLPTVSERHSAVDYSEFFPSFCKVLIEFTDCL
jgi:hypothetical protein